jgi:hypothetical protein
MDLITREYKYTVLKSQALFLNSNFHELPDVAESREADFKKG